MLKYRLMFSKKHLIITQRKCFLVGFEIFSLAHWDWVEDQWLLHSHCRSYWSTRASSFHFQLIDLRSVTSSTAYISSSYTPDSTQSGLSGLRGLDGSFSVQYQQTDPQPFLLTLCIKTAFSIKSECLQYRWTIIRGNMKRLFYEKKSPSGDHCTYLSLKIFALNKPIFFFLISPPASHSEHDRIWTYE